MGKAYLFSFIYYYNSPPQYILVYAENEESAKEFARSKLFYNSGEPAKIEDIISCTFGI